MSKVLKRHGFITPLACKRLIDIYNRWEATANRKDHSGFPMVYCDHDVKSPLDRAVTQEVVQAIRGAVGPVLGFGLGQLLPDTALLAGLGVGGWHPRHADNAKLGVDGRWVPNHTPHRVATAILYLNDDFEGGNIFFDRQMLEIHPQAGLLVAFPSTSQYPHEVRLVTQGRRYSLATWFTVDPVHAHMDLVGQGGPRKEEP